MTHHRPECEEMACEVCAEANCPDRSEPYDDDPHTERIDVLTASVSALWLEHTALQARFDRIVAAIVRDAEGE